MHLLYMVFCTKYNPGRALIIGDMEWKQQDHWIRMLPGVRKFTRQGCHLWFHALTRAALRRTMCSENVGNGQRSTVNPACLIGQPVLGTGVQGTNAILTPYIKVT